MSAGGDATSRSNSAALRPCPDVAGVEEAAPAGLDREGVGVEAEWSTRCGVTRNGPMSNGMSLVNTQAHRIAGTSEEQAPDPFVQRDAAGESLHVDAEPRLTYSASIRISAMILCGPAITIG